ncbi:MAG: hypothetical protein QXK89_10170 [Candidatus Bathyarchaeia archaeon]
MYREVKTLENLVKIYYKIKERLLTPAELKEELSISHKTLYRCLSCLEGMGLIHKRDEDGRYEVIREWQEFKNESEYRVKLEHSRLLLGRIIDYVKGEELRATSLMGDYVNEYLIQHIKSGYPDIYEQYCDWMKKEDLLKKKRKYFKKKVKKIADERGIKLVDNLARAGDKSLYCYHLLRVIEGYLQSNELDKMKIIWKDDYVWDEYRGLALTKDKSLIKDVEELIRSALSSADLAKAFGQMKGAEKHRDEAYFNYRKSVEWLALKVMHGEPLKGICDACPKITIGREKP